MDVTSRVTAWFNQFQEIAALLISTPDIHVLGFAQNPMYTKSDEEVIREIARQGGTTTRQELNITFDPATVPLILQESSSAQTNFGVTLTGSRFLAQTPEGNGYVTVLRGVHQEDVLVLLIVAQSLATSRTADATTRLISHPSTEPTTHATDWQSLAEKWAEYYQTDPRLVKAVVEAEATTNIAGDYNTNGVPHAFGYGQVWPRWHYANIQKAILEATGVSTNTRDEQTLGNFILADNDTSMAAATLVIRDTWTGIGSPINLADYSIYERFAKRYVGPSISQQDLQRRWQIWQKHFQ